MDTKQLRDCTDERLVELDKSLRREIFEARIKNFTNQLDDTASIRRAKRDRARVQTIMSERDRRDRRMPGPDPRKGIGPAVSSEAAEETEES